MGAWLGRGPPCRPGASRPARSRSSVRAVGESRAHARWLALGAHQPGAGMWTWHFTCRSGSRSRARTPPLGKVEPPSGSVSWGRGRERRARTRQGSRVCESSGGGQREYGGKCRARGDAAGAGRYRGASFGHESPRPFERPNRRRSDSCARSDRGTSGRPGSRSRQRASCGVSANGAHGRAGRRCLGPLGGGRRGEPRRAADDRSGRAVHRAVPAGSLWVIRRPSDARGERPLDLGISAAFGIGDHAHGVEGGPPPLFPGSAHPRANRRHWGERKRVQRCESAGRCASAGQSASLGGPFSPLR